MADWLDAEAHADRAFEMFERGRWDEAESELRKALALNPDQAEWHFNLGLTLEAAGRQSEALTSFATAIELMPGEIEPLLAASTAANRLSRHQDALKWLAEATRIDPKNETAYANTMEAHYRLGEHESVETTYYLAQMALEEPSGLCLAVMAESLLDREEFERAGWCLREALRVTPNLPRLRARLGAVLAATGNKHRALQMYLRDLRDDPGNIETLLDFGELLMELSRYSEAAEKFRRVLELEPANIDAHACLGHIAFETQQYEQAHLEFELVLKLDESYPNVRFKLGKALLRRGRKEAGARYLESQFNVIQQLGHADMSPADLSEFGALLIEAGLPRLATELHEMDMASRGETASRLRELALAKFNAGDRAGGVAASRRVLRLDPRCVRSMHNLALSAIEDGRLRTAAGWISRGLQIDRHDEGLRQLRGRLCIEILAAAARRLLGRIKSRSKR